MRSTRPEVSRRRPGPSATAARAWNVLCATAAAPRKRPAKGDDCVAHREVQGPTGPWLLAACADGAGSARRGSQGARLAVAASLRWLERQVRSAGEPQSWPGDELAAAVRASLTRSARGRGEPVGELATTLVCLAAGTDATWVIQVGDVAAVVRLQGGDGFEVPVWPERGEYANETYFATQPDAPWRARCLGRADALALTSDGLLPLAFDLAGRRAHAPFFAGLFAELAASDSASLLPHFRAFLHSPQVAARTDDDVSLLLALRQRDT